MTIPASVFEIIRLGIETLIIIIAGWDLIFKKQTEIWYKRISKIGWVLIVLALGGFSDSVFHLIADKKEKDIAKSEYKKDREKDKEDILNGVETAFKKHNLSYNPVTKTITIIDTTARKPIDPVMDIPKDSAGFIGELEKFKLSIRFGTINNGIAYNARCLFINLKLKNNGELLIYKIDRSENEQIKSYRNQGYKYEMPFKISQNLIKLDTSFIYFKVLYSNKIINGQDQPAVRRIYRIYSDLNPKSMKDIKITEVDDMDTYQKIKQSLIKKKYW